MAIDLQSLFAKSQSFTKTVTVTTTSGIILAYNKDRVAFFISPPSANSVTISPDPITVGGRGIVLAVLERGDPVTIFQWGDAVRRPWSAIAGLGTETLWICEVLALE